MAQGINLLIVDLFPPSARGPARHPQKPLFDEIGDREFLNYRRTSR